MQPTQFSNIVSLTKRMTDSPIIVAYVNNNNSSSRPLLGIYAMALCREHRSLYERERFCMYSMFVLYRVPYQFTLFVRLCPDLALLYLCKCHFHFYQQLFNNHHLYIYRYSIFFLSCSFLFIRFDFVS